MKRKEDNRRPLITLVVVVGALLFLCCFAIVLVFPSGRSSTTTSSTVASGQQGAPADPRQATLTVAYSPEKAALFKSLVDQFNAKRLTTPDKQTMQLALVEKTPDEMVSEALAGPAFQAMTPDSSLWLDQLNRKYAATQKVEPGQIAPRLAGEPVRYAITPIVLAAWEDTAKSLGWPDKPVGWNTLTDRARQDANFKWSHSGTAHASGLLATLAEFYAGAGVQRGLTADLVQKPETVKFVSDVEKTVRYYGEAELAVAQRAAQEGSKYLDAFVIPEQLVVAVNTGAFGKAPAKLIALYPSEGTLWADHPLALLETPDLTANQRRTFQAFREFLAESDVQTQILKAGYRPADLNVSLSGSGSPLTAANGVDPAQPQTTLQLPTADVVAAVQDVFATTKRKVNVFLVVDTSGSMQGSKLSNVQEALKTFLAQIPSDQEQVGLVEFNSQVSNIIELKTLRENRAELNDTVSRLHAGGNTALFDAINTAYQRLQAANEPERINAIVAMTDGKENASDVSLNQLVREIQQGNQGPVKVVIFNIAYGQDADLKAMQAIADASGGQVRTGTPDTIRNLYKILSSYFG
jgi:Ca-activated chloride channel homolog